MRFRCSVVETKDDIDRRFHIYGISAELERLVTCAIHGVQRSGREQRRAAYNARLLCESLFGNHGFDHNRALNARGSRNRRIDRLNRGQKPARSYSRRNTGPDGFGRGDTAGGGDVLPSSQRASGIPPLPCSRPMGKPGTVGPAPPASTIRRGITVGATSPESCTGLIL